MRKRRGRRVNATGRGGDEQFIPVSYPMAKSLAWRALSGAAVKVWIELRSRYNGGNNGDLSVSLDEAARLLGLGKATALRAFADLAGKGFIVMTRRGRWYGRMATTWRVTDRGTVGNPPTNDWKRWEPGKPVAAIADREQGLGSQPDRIEAATAPLQNREPKSWSATEPVEAVSGQGIGSETDRLYNHGLSQAEPPDVKAPLQNALAKSCLGLPHTRPGGSASKFRSALPIGPATEAAMAEKRRAAP